MFKEISKMEQRYDAVLMVIRDGFSVAEVARKFKVSRQTVYGWMARYEAEGIGGLEDHSHRPERMPRQISGELTAAIVAARLAHPYWDPSGSPATCVAARSRRRVSRQSTACWLVVS